MPETDSTPTLCRCDNCDFECEITELYEIKHFHQRVSPGEICPAGECPKCGAVSHLIIAPHHIVVTVEGGLVQSIDNIPDGVEVQVMDFDIEGADEDDLRTNHRGEQYFSSVWGPDVCECQKPGATYSGIPGIVGKDPDTAERCDLCQRYETDEQARAVLRARPTQP